MSFLETRDLCLTEKVDVEKAINRECIGVTNAHIGITFVNSRGKNSLCGDCVGNFH